MFTGFEKHRVRTNGVEINLALGGTGPALLLLHGHPQTYVIWHKVANQLAARFTVVATDLRGYGDSSKPAGLPDHSDYSKRVMAQDQVEVMRQLGFENFFFVGHEMYAESCRHAFDCRVAALLCCVDLLSGPAHSLPDFGVLFGAPHLREQGQRFGFFQHDKRA